MFAPSGEPAKIRILLFGEYFVPGVYSTYLGLKEPPRELSAFQLQAFFHFQPR